MNNSVKTRVSIIVPGQNEGENFADTIDSILSNTTYPDIEVIAVDDGSIDGSGRRVKKRFTGDSRVSFLEGENLGVAGARNFGAQAATGAILVFIDAHCYTPPGWLIPLIRLFNVPNVGLVGPAIANLRTGSTENVGLGQYWRDTTLALNWYPILSEQPYLLPFMPGGCHVVRRDIFEAIGRYDPGMIRWGSEDIELSIRMWLLGYQVVAQPQSLIYHHFRYTNERFTVLPEQAFHNLLRMATLHLSKERLEKVVSHYQQFPTFELIKEVLDKSDAHERRQQLLDLRVHDDTWLLERFNLISIFEDSSEEVKIEDIQEIPIEDVKGVGPRRLKLLIAGGISSARMLANASPEAVIEATELSEIQAQKLIDAAKTLFV